MNYLQATIERERVGELLTEDRRMYNKKEIDMNPFIPRKF